MPKSLRKGQEDEQSLAELCSAHCHLQAKCQLVQISPFCPSLIGLYGRILASVLCTDLTVFSLYPQPPA